MRPPVTFSSPPIERRSVVFPQPDGPTSTMNSPSPIVRSTSSTARTPPANSLTTWSRTISPKAAELYPVAARNEPPRRAAYSGPMRLGSQPTAVSSSVSLFRDTCNVYVLRTGAEAVLVDFGDGDVLGHLGALGVERVTDVLLTHHHRDSLGGLGRAVDAGIRVWAPPFDAELIADATGHWLRRPLDVDYDLREDRFSLLESVPIAGTVAEYRTTRVGGIDVFTLPTPGHTPGSVTYVIETDGRKLAFTGDLVYGDGMVWSLAATQWSYSGVEGQGATIISCAKLAALDPDVLLPAHGEPIEHPPAALATVRERI